MAGRVALGAAERGCGAGGFEPEIGVVRCDRQRAMEGLQRVGQIVGSEVNAGIGRQAVGALALLVVGQGQIILEVVGLLDEIVRQEGQPRRSANIPLLLAYAVSTILLRRWRRGKRSSF